MKRILGYVLLGLVAVAAVLGLIEALQSPPGPLADRLQMTLDRAVDRRSSSYPGALLYLSDEDTVWAGASGLADVATEEAMARDSRFCIGSITKPFVATVVLQLMEEGLIELDAPIGKYLKADVSTTVDPSGRITVRMLLNHTSGLPEWLTDNVVSTLIEAPSTVWDTEDLLGIAMAQTPSLEPGEGFMYSNTDYTLLGVIIEGVTGNSWRDQVTRRILEPLGLENTVVRVPGDAGSVPRLAHGYVMLGQDLIDVTDADPSMAGAAGGNAMVSTTSDLAVFINALLNGELFASTQTLAAMLDFVDAPDEQGVPYWYGLGLERYDINGMTFIGHGGGAVGYSTAMYVAPDEGITIVTSDNIDDLATAYLDLMIPALRELER